MRRLSLLHFIRLAALALLGICVAGCSTAKAPRSQSNPELFKLTSFWQPQLLYILPSPCSRLYVEVDAVEGCQPGDATLNKLREFLSTYCHKPDGIEIVRGEVIPAATARGVPLRALARKFMNGPPESTDTSKTAYLYVLYCNPALCNKPPIVDADTLGVKTAPHWRNAEPKPHVDFLPYPPVMYINPRYGPKSVQNELLIHEAGHELGLAGRSTNAFAYHCLDQNCLMNWTLRYHFSRALFSMDPINQHHLCAICAAQLTESAKQPPPANLRFVGPVLVRTERGYHVLSLPDRVKIIAGDLNDHDCREFANAVRDETIPPRNEDGRVDWFIKDEILDDPAKFSELFAQVKSDPLELLRTTVPKIFARCYVSRGHYTNAIEICRQAIAANPQADWSYNLLAWVRATCPDADVRDGKEAVSAATRACDLTNWNESSWIDTLAAAYAESGDFQRALQFEEQALRGCNVSKSELSAMQERLALYKQSQPYREKR